MMQSSDLDRKSRTHSPSEAKKNHRSSDHSHISESGNFTSEIPLNDIPKSLEITQINGKINCDQDQELAVTEIIPETLPLMDNSSGNQNSENHQQSGFLPVLKNQNFLALWAGQVFCQLADKVYLV
ncbi:MAG: MFS transporter, partial [Dolichospermum sp.]